MPSIGGASPLLAEYRGAGARAGSGARRRCRCFIAMRYWHPLSDGGGARRSKQWGPTRSCCCRSIRNSRRRRRHRRSRPGDERRRRAGLDVPTHGGLLLSRRAGLHRRARRATRSGARAMAERRRRCGVLLSAHGLPQQIVARGDPYQWQIERDRGGAASRARAPGLGLAGLLPEPGRAARMARALDRCRDPPRRRRAGRPRRRADLLRLGAFGDAGRARPRLSASSPTQCGVPRYRAGADGRRPIRASSPALAALVRGAHGAAAPAGRSGGSAPARSRSARARLREA